MAIKDEDMEEKGLRGKAAAAQATRTSHSSVATRLGRLFSARSGAARVVLAACVSIGWMIVSNMLILINKHILKDLKFPYPMTVSSMGMLASGFLSYLVCRVFKLTEANTQISLRFYCTNILPIGFFMALTLWSGNAVYLYLTVSFIQMLKAFTPVITMLALFLAGLETPTSAMVSSVLAIAAGTALAAYGEVAFDPVGAVIMLVSALSESLRLVMTQYLLVGLKMGPFEGVMYLGPACFVWLVMGGLAVEVRQIASTGALAIARANWILFTTAACMGFAINVLAFATIKLASSLTLKVLGTVKNALLIVAACIMYGEVVTGIQAWGYFVSTGAFGVFTYIKMRQIASGP